MQKKIISIISAGLFSLLSVVANSEQFIIPASEMEVGTDFYLTDDTIITSAMFDPDLSMGSIINLVDETGINLTVKPADEAKKKLALFQVKCKKSPCNISGKLKLTYPWGEPEVVFEFFGYSGHDKETIDLSLSDIIQNTKRVPIKLTGFASFSESVESFLLKANIERLSSDRVTVDLTNLTEDNLLKFIENCYNTCERLLVTGNLYPSSSSSRLIAETITKK